VVSLKSFGLHMLQLFIPSLVTWHLYIFYTHELIESLFFGNNNLMNNNLCI